MTDCYWVIAIKHEGSPDYYLRRTHMVRMEWRGRQSDKRVRIFDWISVAPPSGPNVDRSQALRFDDLKMARNICKEVVADRQRLSSGELRQNGSILNPGSPGTPKVYLRTKKGLLAAAGSLQAAGRLLQGLLTPDKAVAQLAATVKQIHFAVVRMMPKPLRRVARNQSKIAVCVSPNGRTDRHNKYMRRVNGVMMCAFCLND